MKSMVMMSCPMVPATDVPGHQQAISPISPHSCSRMPDAFGGHAGLVAAHWVAFCASAVLDTLKMNDAYEFVFDRYYDDLGTLNTGGTSVGNSGCDHPPAKRSTRCTKSSFAWRLSQWRDRCHESNSLCALVHRRLLSWSWRDNSPNCRMNRNSNHVVVQKF